ncbi:protein regulator of cytokinesis 1-like [Drosophila serrata]|uniref:protein regulator of cytokinesis 1-like n=1 Tax=Drosophila serrata TaxID=7274 RepID=UPI000A1D1595|nr:protein regulator of cytokinesis 1-like [Drosophila serrata]
MNPLSTKSQILDMTSDQVDQLHGLWEQMFPPETCEEHLQRLKEHIKDFYDDLLNESREKEQTIYDNIASLREQANHLGHQLSEPLDVTEKPDDVPLVIWQLKLEKSIEFLQDKLASRRAEIGKLLLVEQQICHQLGELPLPLPVDPLPLPEKLGTIRDHIDQLRDLREERIKEVDLLRRSIKKDMELLECIPTDSEKRLLNQANHCLTPDDLEQLRQMQKDFADQMGELRKRIDDMREKISVLWDQIQDKDENARKRVQESVAYTQYTHDILVEELQRCQNLRRQKMKTYIEQLRLEIKELWDLTLKSTQERKRFYHNEWYPDLLELHELEYDDLQTFYNKNKEIFKLFKARTVLWERMLALEVNTSDPNRFNNRGAQLLKEERESKAITSKLSQIEQQIIALVRAYETRENTPFLVHGENILKRMADDWEQYRQTKQHSFRKKAEKTLQPTAPGSLRNLSALSSSTSSLHKSASQQSLKPLNKLPPSSKKETAKTSSKDIKSQKPSPTIRNTSQRLLMPSQKTNQLKAAKPPLKEVGTSNITLRSTKMLNTKTSKFNSYQDENSKPECKAAKP